MIIKIELTNEKINKNDKIFKEKLILPEKDGEIT